jgi:hypothetical protein
MEGVCHRFVIYNERENSIFLYGERTPFDPSLYLYSETENSIFLYREHTSFELFLYQFLTSMLLLSCKLSVFDFHIFCYCVDIRNFCFKFPNT